MNDELELLRDVVRALVAERRARAEWSRALSPDGKKPTKDQIDAAAPLHLKVGDCRTAIDQALGRLAEVNPELVNG